MPLGKSLENILGDYFGDESVDLNHNPITPQLTNLIPINQIEVSQYQTRTNFDFEKIRSLANSIRDHGLIHPVVVLEKKTFNPGELPYTLLAGERRLRACKMLDFEQIPSIVKKESELSPQQQAMLTAMENLQREDLTPIEQAKTFQMLIQTQNVNEEGLAQMLESSAQYVKNYLRLLTLSKPVQQALNDRKIGEGHARYLVGLEENRQLELLSIILQKELTVKEIALLMKQQLEIEFKEPQKQSTTHSIPSEVVTKAQKLAEFFPKSKLQCSGNPSKGKIIISWGN